MFVRSDRPQVREGVRMNSSNPCGQENDPDTFSSGQGSAGHRRFRSEANDWNLRLEGGVALLLGKLGGGARRWSNGKCRLEVLFGRLGTIRALSGRAAGRAGEADRATTDDLLPAIQPLPRLHYDLTESQSLFTCGAGRELSMCRSKNSMMRLRRSQPLRRAQLV